MPAILILLLTISLLCPLKNSAQPAYRLTYKGGYGKYVSSAGIATANYRMEILTDTAYYVLPVLNKNSNKKTFVYGDKIKHHSFYYFSNSKKYYYGNHYPALSKPYLTSSEPITISNPWVVDTTVSHYFQEYRCAKAYNVSLKGDTNFVIYSPDIKYPPGLKRYYGLPGVVMEMYDSRTGYYWSLIKIEKGPFEIILPNNFELKTKGKKRN